MKSLSVGAFAVAALFCITPVSPHWSQGKGPSVAVASADAADLSIPPRHRAVRYGRLYGHLYDPYCNGPYTNNWNVGILHGDYGGSWHGGTYRGGPWMLLHCYGLAPAAPVGPVAYAAPAPYGYGVRVNYHGYDRGYSPGIDYGHWW
jgi:hypothetical protein